MQNTFPLSTNVQSYFPENWLKSFFQSDR